MHKGAIALAVMAALGLAVGFFSVTWLSSPGAGARPVAAAVPDEGLGDAIACGTGQPVMDAALDIAAVSVTSKPGGGGYDVHVRFAGSAAAVFSNAYSAAVLVTLGNQTGIAEIHAGTETRGLEDDLANIIPGTEDNVSIESDGVHFNFPGELKEGAELEVETFHAKTILDDVECDTAFSDDPLAQKTQSPGTTTATAAAEPPTPTPTATPEGTGKITVITHTGPTGVGVPGFQINLHAGDGCLPDSVIASGVTDAEGVVSFPNLQVGLAGGSYSASVKPRVGWNDGEGGCSDIGFLLDRPGGGPNVGVPVTRDRNGDVNEDGVTNSIDVVLVLQAIAGLISDPSNHDRADVNGDGVINTVDTALMLQFEAGLLDSLPVRGS